MARTADEQNKSLKEGGNFGAVTSSLHYSLLFPHTLFRLLWVSFSLISPPIRSVLYLISPAQVFYSTQGNLIWLSSIQIHGFLFSPLCSLLIPSRPSVFFSLWNNEWIARVIDQRKINPSAVVHGLRLLS